MLKKITTITFLFTVAATSVFAQRDFRRERAELDREERAEKRRMREERSERHYTNNYGANILRLSPITAMDIGVGFGLSYERILDRQGMVGLVLPVHLILENDGDDFLNGNGDWDNTHAYVYFTPGLKIYPFGQRKVTYAVGPNLMLGYGGGKEWYYDGYYSQRVDVTRLRLGMLVNNYVNFQLGPSFNLGLELGLGVRYLDRETVDYPTFPYSNTTRNNGIEATGQFSMTLGFRF